MSDLRVLEERVNKTREGIIFSANSHGTVKEPTVFPMQYVLDCNALLASLEAAERDRDVVLEQFAERTADWNTTLERAETAEAALKTAVRLVWAWREYSSPDFFPDDTIYETLAETDEFLKRWWVPEGQGEEP